MPVAVRFTKWGGQPHWHFDTVYLGCDEYGRWVAGPGGTPMARPGVATTTSGAFVVCFAHCRGFAATFYEIVPGQPTAVYVDITDVPCWTCTDDAVQVGMNDLDLDVIAPVDGQVYVDDEDEFADHQVSLRYPEPLVAAARRECTAVFDEVRLHSEPYGTVGANWLARYEAGR